MSGTVNVNANIRNIHLAKSIIKLPKRERILFVHFDSKFTINCVFPDIPKFYGPTGKKILIVGLSLMTC